MPSMQKVSWIIFLKATLGKERYLSPRDHINMKNALYYTAYIVLCKNLLLLRYIPLICTLQRVNEILINRVSIL